MNRRELLGLFGSTGVVAAVGGPEALERLFEPMRAIEPADSGYIVATGVSPYALTLQWGKSDAQGMARYPLAFNTVFNFMQNPLRGYIATVGHAETLIEPDRYWIAWGLT